MTSTCFKICTVCYHQHDHFCNQLFLALTDVTDVALIDASVKVLLYKRWKFCPVFFALSTSEEASHSWGETFGDRKRHRLVCGKLLENHDPARITQKLCGNFFHDRLKESFRLQKDESSVMKNILQTEAEELSGFTNRAYNPRPQRVVCEV